MKTEGAESTKANDIEYYEQFGLYQLDDGRWAATAGERGSVIVSDDPEALLSVISYIAMKAGDGEGVAFEELNSGDLSDYLGDGAGLSRTDEYIDGRAVYEIAPAMLQKANQFDHTEFLGDGIPVYPEEATIFLEQDEFDFDDPETGESTLAGFRGAANVIYDKNYESAPGEPLKKSDIPPALWLLMEFIFPGQELNEGHLNVMKMMNLATGSGSDPSTWTMTADGRDVTKAMNANKKSGEGSYPPAIGLLGYGSRDRELAASTEELFVDGDFAEGETPQDVIDIATRVGDNMQSAAGDVPFATPLPEGTRFNKTSVETMNALFELPPGNTEFSAEQLAIAIDMGLIAYDSQTGIVRATPNGFIFLEAAQAEEES